MGEFWGKQGERRTGRGMASRSSREGGGQPELVVTGEREREAGLTCIDTLSPCLGLARRKERGRGREMRWSATGQGKAEKHGEEGGRPGTHKFLPSPGARVSTVTPIFGREEEKVRGLVRAVVRGRAEERRVVVRVRKADISLGGALELAGRAPPTHTRAAETAHRQERGSHVATATARTLHVFVGRPPGRSETLDAESECARGRRRRRRRRSRRGHGSRALTFGAQGLRQLTATRKPFLAFADVCSRALTALRSPDRTRLAGRVRAGRGSPRDDGARRGGQSGRTGRTARDVQRPSVARSFAPG